MKMFIRKPWPIRIYLFRGNIPGVVFREIKKYLFIKSFAFFYKRPLDDSVLPAGEHNLRQIKELCEVYFILPLR
ncbi:hypothetical protein CSC91_15390 [Klebsiella pneumoniae]|nr:hypothetical protein CSC91_15390 [Klebsiella pneumoniae]